MHKSTETEFIFTGTLIDGPDVDLVNLSGLELTADEEDEIWGEINSRELLTDYLECEELELYEIDEVPGCSDSYYEYRCGDKQEFIEKLRSFLLERIGKSP